MVYGGGTTPHAGKLPLVAGSDGLGPINDRWIVTRHVKAQTIQLTGSATDPYASSAI
jgi:hypothetical protein